MKIKQKELNTQLTFSRILSCTAWILILFYFPETLEVLYTKCSDRTSSVIFFFHGEIYAWSANVLHSSFYRGPPSSATVFFLKFPFFKICQNVFLQTSSCLSVVVIKNLYTTGYWILMTPSPSAVQFKQKNDKQVHVKRFYGK